MFSIPGAESFDGCKAYAVFIRELVLCFAFRARRKNVDTNDTRDSEFETWISEKFDNREGTRLNYLLGDIELDAMVLQLLREANVRGDSPRVEFIKAFISLCLDPKNVGLADDKFPEAFEFLVLDDKKPYLVTALQKLFRVPEWTSFLQENMSEASYRIISGVIPDHVVSSPIQASVSSKTDKPLKRRRRVKVPTLVDKAVDKAPEAPSFVIPETRDGRHVLLLAVYKRKPEYKLSAEDPGLGFLIDVFFPNEWPDIETRTLREWLADGTPNEKIAEKLKGS